MSTLREQLEADLKQAMRAQNALELSVLRMAKSAIQYKAVEPNAKPLVDMDIVAVLRKLINQRKDAAEQFRQGNREELAAKEESEILILQRYLPKPLSAEELSQVVRQTIAELGISGPKSFGVVMKKVVEQVQARAEGKAISEEVKKQLV
ncbi:MAG: GatB/YqeY domain-containing protein [Cystobacterineae bacterium]|nr:GatB/YqeY domain-containing protein [Cystobacterineae bacterium]